MKHSILPFLVALILPASAATVVYQDGVTQVFNPSATLAGVNVGAVAGDPSAPVNGDLWYDSTANELTARINGANVALGAGGGGGGDLTAVASNILPDADSTRNIGSDTFRWANIYADNLDLLTLAVETFGLLDTNQSHTLALAYGEDASTNNTLTITTGNGNSAVDYTDPGVDGMRVWDETSNRVETTPLPAGYVYDDVNLRTGIFTEKHAASHTLTDLECYGSVYYITAASTTLTAPAIATGMSFTVICTTANVGSVDVNASDKIYLDGVALDDGDKATSSGAAGDIIVFTYYDGTGWWGTSNGWIDGGP